MDTDQLHNALALFCIYPAPSTDQQDLAGREHDGHGYYKLRILNRRAEVRWIVPDNMYNCPIVDYFFAIFMIANMIMYSEMQGYSIRKIN